jgi:hypothetical protein
MNNAESQQKLNYLKRLRKDLVALDYDPFNERPDSTYQSSPHLLQGDIDYLLQDYKGLTGKNYPEFITPQESARRLESNVNKARDLENQVYGIEKTPTADRVSKEWWNNQDNVNNYIRELESQVPEIRNMLNNLPAHLSYLKSLGEFSARRHPDPLQWIQDNGVDKIPQHALLNDEWYKQDNIRKTPSVPFMVEELNKGRQGTISYENDTPNNQKFWNYYAIPYYEKLNNLRGRDNFLDIGKNANLGTYRTNELEKAAKAMEEELKWPHRKPKTGSNDFDSDYGSYIYQILRPALKENLSQEEAYKRENQRILAEYEKTRKHDEEVKHRTLQEVQSRKKGTLLDKIVNPISNVIERGIGRPMVTAGNSLSDMALNVIEPTVREINRPFSNKEEMNKLNEKLRNDREEHYEQIMQSQPWMVKKEDRVSPEQHQKYRQDLEQLRHQEAAIDRILRNSPHPTNFEEMNPALRQVFNARNQHQMPQLQRTQLEFLENPAAMQALQSIMPSYLAMRNQINQGAEGEQPRYIPRPQRRDRFRHVMSNFAPENFQAGLDPNAQYLPYHLRRNI